MTNIDNLVRKRIPIADGAGFLGSHHRGIYSHNGYRRWFTGPVNIGNPHELTLKQLSEQVIELTGSSSKI